MVPVALLYAAGLVLAEYLQPPLAGLWLVTLLVLGATLLGSAARPWLLGVLLVLMGWLNLAGRTAIVSPNDLRLLQGGPVETTLRGRLRETPQLRLFVRDAEESYRTLARLEVQAVRDPEGWKPAHGSVLVLTPGTLGEEFCAGQRVEVTGILGPPPAAAAPALFDYRAYLRRQGIYFQLRAASSNDWRVVADRPAARPLADRFVQWARATLRRGLPVEDEPVRLLWAMTLGWRPGLSGEIREPFMRSGTMHIFAISGLHIALIAGIVVSLLRVLQLPRAGCGALVVPLLWGYTAATGWQPSAVRATVMMSVVVGGWALRRPSDLLNSLAASAFLILLGDPQQLFQASFQLSFFVVLSIALLLPPIERACDRLLQTDPLLPPELLPRWRRWLSGPLRWFTTAAATSLAAWLGSLPLTAHYFHLFSPVTLLANLGIVPLATLALMSGLGSLVTGAWWPGLAVLFNHSAWFWMRLMLDLSEWFARLPGAFWYVKSFTLPETLLYYVVLIGLLSGWLWAAQRRRPALVALALLAGACGWQWQRQRQVITLSAIPLSGGSTVFCDLPGRAADLLVDCGQTNPVQFVTAPFLRAQGVNRLPRLLLTHGDLRQMGGAEPLLHEFRVRQVLASGVRQLSPTYRRVMERLRQDPQRLRLVQRGESIGPWQVLHPAATNRFKQADDNAVVLRGEFHGTRVLLLSDLGRPGQEALMQSEADLRADIVLTGLPQEGEPLCDALLERAAPQVVVVLDSEYPASERAPPPLRERLRRPGVPVLCTREVGAVQLKLRPGRWTLVTCQGTRLSGRPRAGPKG